MLQSRHCAQLGTSDEGRNRDWFLDIRSTSPDHISVTPTIASGGGPGRIRAVSDPYDLERFVGAQVLNRFFDDASDPETDLPL